MKALLNIIAAGLILAPWAPIYAAATKGFASADTNRDRALTRAEACAGKTRTLCRNFDVIDVNRDGILTRAEVKAFRSKKRIAKGLPPAR